MERAKTGSTSCKKNKVNLQKQLQQLAVKVMNPREISIHDFTYNLPEERIAKFPPERRDDARLLIYQNGSISEDVFNQIDNHLPANSLLVFNNTKVVEARLLFQKPTGGIVEIFCLEPHEMYGDITNGMLQTGKVLWKCLIGGAGKWKHGQVLQKQIESGGESLLLEACYLEKLPDCFIIELSWNPVHYSFAEILHRVGLIPLPPYIKRIPDKSDSLRYQTVYAKEDGSVAAPTAGLHFTLELLNKLLHKNTHQAFVSLHVGAGTFKPVKSDTMNKHEMHAEFIHVTQGTIEQLLKYGGNIFAIGTTSLRTLESIYWMGIKTKIYPNLSESKLSIGQWEAYDYTSEISALQSMESLLDWMLKNKKKEIITKTSILIAPGYKVKMITGLVTNFHQPRSTLLLLVAALIGDDWRKVYNYALENGFRFLSYGDGCLLKL